MDAKLPVDAGTLDAGEDAQVGGEPRGVWRERERNAVVRRTRRQEAVEELASLLVCAARRRNAISLHTGACVLSRVFPASRPAATFGFPASAQT